MELPNQCRKCEKVFSKEKCKNGIFHIPYTQQWFRLKSVNIENIKNIDKTNAIYYCSQCYIDICLANQHNIKCSICGIFSDYYWYYGIVDSKLIIDTMTLGKCEIVNNTILNLKTNDKICYHCLKYWTDKGWIKGSFLGVRKRNEKKFKKWIPKLNAFIFNQEDEEKYPEQVPNSVDPLSFIEEEEREKIHLSNVEKLPEIAGFSSFIETKKKILQCDQCNKKYRSLQSLDIGGGCDGSMTEFGISCGYGSKYDETQFSWKEKLMPDRIHSIYKKKEKYIICDNCIDNLLRLNHIECFISNCL